MISATQTAVAGRADRRGCRDRIAVMDTATGWQAVFPKETFMLLRSDRHDGYCNPALPQRAGSGDPILAPAVAARYGD